MGGAVSYERGTPVLQEGGGGRRGAERGRRRKGRRRGGRGGGMGGQGREGGPSRKGYTTRSLRKGQNGDSQT